MHGIFPLAVVDVSTAPDREMAQSLHVSADLSSTPSLYTLSPSPFDNQKSQLVPVGTKKSSSRSSRSGMELGDLAYALQNQQRHVLRQRGVALGLPPPSTAGASTANHQSPPPETNGTASASNVVGLTVENLDRHVWQNPAAVAVAFAAPWCGHCTKLRPAREAAAQALAEERNVVLGWIDATAPSHQPLAALLGVRGYPTIRIFPGGAPKVPDTAVDYQGSRETADIVRALRLAVDRSGGPPETLSGGHYGR